MDEIQEKIEDFKKSLESSSPLKEIIFNCPAVLPAIGLVCGLVVQYYSNLNLLIPIIILMITAVLYYLGRTHRFAPTTVLLFICVFLCFACLGSIRLIKLNSPAANDVRILFKDGESYAYLKGQIISEPVIVENNDWHFAKWFPQKAYTTFYADISNVKTESGWTNVSGTIKFYVSQKTDKLKAGDKFETFCSIDTFSMTDNPGEFDFKNYMQQNGIYYCASVKSAQAITIFERQNIKSGMGIRARLNSLAAVWLTNNEDDNYSSLVEAMILGSRTKIDRKLYNDFINTGLVHLICLSGLNVGIFAGVAWWLSKKAGLLHKGRAIACLVATVIFLFIVPAQSSILRAGIMFIVSCLARLFSRQSNLLNCIAISMIIILLISPLDFLTPSFQLSFAATIGIVLFCPVFFNFLLSIFGDLDKNFIYKMFKGLLAAFSTGCTAWLFVAPVTAFHFYQTQLLTAIWTIPAMIPATIIIVLGTFKILLNPLLPSLAFGLAFIIDFSAKILIDLVTVFAKVPFSNIFIGKTPIFIILFFYAVLVLWKFFPFKSFKKQLVYPCLLVFICAPMFIRNNDNLRLEVLSVGHGQCCVLSAEGENFIIDAGSMTKGDIGERVINTYLNYAAIKNIDSVFISHDDIDHFNGLPEIANKHHINNFYTTAKLIDSNSGTAIELKKLYSFKAAPEKIKYKNLTITRLWPTETSFDSSDNESALVLLIEYKGRKILFCSDIIADVQEKLMKIYPQLDIDVLITPHHGSTRTTNPEFLTFFKPEYYITSCGDTQFARTFAEIKDSKNNYFTSRDGAIEINIDSNNIFIKRFDQNH